MKLSLLTVVKRWTSVAAAFCGILAFNASTAQAITCEVTPREVPISISYHGAKLTITGQTAPDDDLILKISSKPHDTAMKYYGKAGGLVWMKQGGLEFKGVPGVYLVNTTKDMNLILSETERNQYQLGYDAMAKATKIEDDKGQPAERKWFDEFTRFKEKEMIYKVEQGTITRRHGEKGNTFEIVVNWPYQAPPGIYNIDLLAVNNGKVVDKAATTFEVKRVGVIAALSKMAVDQAALYGIMSVLIALAAGSAVGAIFKKGGGSH
ncbi:MAG: TIGR02186 family protein [Desulfocapsaceae bacterium]|nr:TIGR02186 family protein [Desulfocapsaceae bacterium]